MNAIHIAEHPIHLGLGAAAVSEPRFTGSTGGGPLYRPQVGAASGSADGSKRSVQLGAGEYAINEPGTWHTADADASATALFITAGLGTQHRQR